MTWKKAPGVSPDRVPHLTVSNGASLVLEYYAEVPTFKAYRDAIRHAPKGVMHFYDANNQAVYPHIYLPSVDMLDIEAFYNGVRRVFVVERRGSPMISNGFCVMALPSITTAVAWHETTSEGQRGTDRAVPYISVEVLDAFIEKHGPNPELQALIDQARLGCPC